MFAAVALGTPSRVVCAHRACFTTGAPKGAAGPGGTSLQLAWRVDNSESGSASRQITVLPRSSESADSKSNPAVRAGSDQTHPVLQRFIDFQAAFGNQLH